MLGIIVAKLAMEKIYEDFGVFPENTNFGIKSSVPKLIIANDINLIKENKKEIKNFGKYIRRTHIYHVGCQKNKLKNTFLQKLCLKMLSPIKIS